MSYILWKYNNKKNNQVSSTADEIRIWSVNTNVHL